MLKAECLADHVDRVKELPSEELDEFWDELAILSDQDCSLVWIAAYVTI